MTLFTTQRPLLSVKATARFPANVTADTGLSVTKTNGTYNFGFDFTGLTENTSLATPSEWWTLVYNDQTETYEQVRVDALVDYTIDTRRGIGDTNDTLLSNDRYVELTASLSAARTWTLPAASSVTGGVHIIVQDAAGGINGSNTLTIQRAGSDTINGATSVEFSTAYDGAIFYSDGTSKWSYVRRPSTVTVASGKTVTFNNTLTFSGTDSSSVALGAGGTVAYTSNKLSAFAATTSAELRGVLSDETGTGAAVFADSPTLITPALGTPSSGTLTNCTGLPVASGISGFGTGVATALAVNVGSAGAPVVLNGALGTPSSGTLTNCTGLPISTGVSGLAANVATFLATPSSANLAAAITDEEGSGPLVFRQSPYIISPTFYKATIDAGTTTDWQLKFTSSTILTTPAAGVVEWDGKVPYITAQGTQRGVWPSEQFFRLNSDLAGANVNTVQSVFGVGVTLSSSTVYSFELMMLFVKTAGATSHNFSFGFGGTATINNALFYALADAETSAFSSGTLVGGAPGFFVFTSLTAGALIASIASANSNVIVRVIGNVSVNSGGTLIPQYTLSAAPGGAYSTIAGSYMAIYPVSASGANTSVGDWA